MATGFSEQLKFICAGCRREYADMADLLACVERHKPELAGVLTPTESRQRQKGIDLYAMPQDDGCAIAPKCVEYPLEVCVFDWIPEPSR